ncbi:hypothetical protein GALMADRAFT_254415 [Galerina marginata CBS 339.88]|uniref:Uncharacterized protein n=1 Tax=Galerina marginata (strain CBS 339.88) TaxID=685588 RepID=A0A067SL66_GALM3|nr:hypothetical protein GALMADRAFT_254415 [Galerina marginata CBS 339.88]
MSPGVHAFQPIARQWLSPLSARDNLKTFSAIASSLKPRVVAWRIELMSQSTQPLPPIATCPINDC